MFLGGVGLQELSPRCSSKGHKALLGLRALHPDHWPLHRHLYSRDPGSGSSINKTQGWDELVDLKGKPGDPTLKFISELWMRAAARSPRTPHSDDFIEILNTYYFRCSNSAGTSQNTLNAWRQSSSPYWQTISARSRFIWLGWGAYMHSQPEVIGLCQHIRSLIKIPVIVPVSGGGVKIFRSDRLPCDFPFPFQPSAVRINRLHRGFRENLAPVLSRVI